jgi:hypothetical protein
MPQLQPVTRTYMLSIVDDDALDDPDVGMPVLAALIRFLDLEPEDTRQRLIAFLEESSQRDSAGAQEVVGVMFANL